MWTVIALVVIQFIPINRTNLPVKSEENFVNVMHTPPKITEILKNACYDCHSNETQYPNYAYIAPISWSVKHHINEGREHANFSVWANYNKDLKKSILENTIESVPDRKMPIAGYMVYHPKANLTEAERKLLAAYFEGILKSGNY